MSTAFASAPPSWIQLDQLDAPLALCSSSGAIEAATPRGAQLLARLGALPTVPGQLPRELWEILSRLPVGEAAQWRPPIDQQRVLGCTRYAYGDKYLLLMKEVTDQHTRLLRQLHRQRLETTGRLVASIAHELRNSVATIVYGAYCLDVSHSELKEQELGEATHEILHASSHLQQIVDGLLDYAKLGPTVSVAVSLREVLTRAQGFLRPVFKRGAHHLEIEIPPEANWIQGNTIIVEQIFVNLILNAVQASAGSARVAIRAERIAGQLGQVGCVRVRVQDDGPGVPARIRNALFEPFFTTSDGGVGLGLPDARHAAESLGGALALEPSDAGACFAVTLPAADPSEEG